MTIKKVLYALASYWRIRRFSLRILDSALIRPEYRMGRSARVALGWRFFLNTLRIQSGTDYRVHLAMALKLLEMDPAVQGDVIECGSWKGGSTANLSLVCRITGRKLLVYDSFRGLPPATPGDRQAAGYKTGDFAGALDEVKENIRKCGAIEVCEFVEGWYKDTLPSLQRPIALAFLDVDIEASLDTCVRYIWPRLVQSGYVFTDEATGVNYVALFYSEKWWRKNFNSPPPGIIGSGTGLPLGNIYVGPYDQRFALHPGQQPSSGAYTYKGLNGEWTYYPDE